MQMTKAARGRPKGTGLDDAAALAELRARLAADPNLKPTTAIKTMGITNPSVIRRLRDKLCAADTSALPVTVASPKPRAVALGGPSEPRRKGPVRQAKAPSPEPVTSVEAGPVQTPQPAFANPVLAAWLSLGVEMWMASAKLHLVVVEQVLRLPELNPMLRHHAALADRSKAAGRGGESQVQLLH